MKTISLKDKIASLPVERQQAIRQLAASLTILDPLTGQLVTIEIKPR
jgi:hypothetical protein